MRLHRGLAAVLPLVVAATSLAMGGQASAAPSHHVTHPDRTTQLRERGVLASGPLSAGAVAAGEAATRAPFLAATTITGPALVYGQLASTGRALMVRNLTDGTVNRLLGFSQLNCYDEPVVSPDGSKIAFLNTVGDGTCQKTGSSVEVYDVATHLVTNVAPAPPSSSADLPSWSHDGTSLLFTLVDYNPDGSFLDSNLFTVPAVGGTDPAPLAGAGAGGYDGVYSPDGTTIAFAPSTGNALALVASDGNGTVTPLPGTGLSADFSPALPAWSPDGLHISYAYDRPVPGVSPALHSLALAVIDASGANGHLLAGANKTRQGSFVSTWSSDSTEILYDARTYDAAGNVNNNTEIFSTDLVGTRSAKVVTSPTDVVYAPSFISPGPTAPTASTYTPITPTRALPKTALGTGGTVDVQVAGGTTTIPANATAVTVNLTGVAPTASTYLQVYPRPAGTAVPLVSNINLTPGLTAAVAAQVTVGANGYIRVRNYAGTTGVIVDISGYFTPDTTHAGYQPLDVPVRVMYAPIPGGQAEDVTVTGGTTGAPAGATAVVLNLSGVRPATGSYLSVYPTVVVPGIASQAHPAPAPAFSNLNLTAGSTRANLVTVPIGPGGQISIYNYRGTVQTAVDIQGYYVAGGLAYYPLTPTRVLDTRSGTSTTLGSTAPIGAGKNLDLPLLGTTTTTSGIVTLPADAAVAVLNVTAPSPSVDTFMTVFALPASSSRPATSTLNPAPGSAVSNLAVSKLGGTQGAVRIFNANGSCPVLADIAGYYAPPPGP